MTRTFLIASMVWLSISSHTVTAQRRWNIGLRAGIGLTGRLFTEKPSIYSIAYQYREDFRPGLALPFGVRVAYRLTNRFTVETGMEYQFMQDRLIVDPRDWLYNRTYYQAHRLQLPLQLRFHLTESPRSAYLLAGLSAGYLLFLKEEVQDYDTYIVDLNMPPKRDLIRGRLPRYQVPLVIGGGLTIGRNVSVEVTYQYMRRPMEFLREDPGSVGPGIIPSVSWMNRGVFLTATYWFSKRS